MIMEISIDLEGKTPGTFDLEFVIAKSSLLSIMNP